MPAALMETVVGRKERVPGSERCSPGRRIPL
jgi:hypothetical protein